MKIKNYIAILLAFLFLAKFIAIDANGLNLLFGGNTITFVKPFCKKKIAPKLVDNKIEFSQVDLVSSHEILLSGFCTSPFSFEVFSWNIKNNQTNSVFNDYFTSRLSYRYLESVSPPPRYI